MKKNILAAIALILVFAFVGCINVQQPSAATAEPVVTEAPTPEPTEAPTPEPTAEPTAEPAKENYVTGKVVECVGNGLLVNTSNGNTILFMISNLSDVVASTGDEVGVTYTGNILDAPEVTKLDILEKALVKEISGTVFKVLDNQMFLEISSSEVICFALLPSTVYTGADNVVANDVVTVTYDGQLSETPVATAITITKAQPNRKEVNPSEDDPDEPINKTLTGIVSKLSNSSITIVTSKNKSWKFERNSSTKTTGSYDLEVGAKVRITYDGYASNVPPAKTIKVLAPYDPTPTTHKITGIIQSIGGMVLSLDNGFFCDLAYAKHVGNGDVGDRATVTYYTQNGENFATKVVYEHIYYEEPDIVVAD